MNDKSVTAIVSNFKNGTPCVIRVPRKCCDNDEVLVSNVVDFANFGNITTYYSETSLEKEIAPKVVLKTRRNSDNGDPCVGLI